MRSYLFVPGDAPRKLEKVFASSADVVIVDLEDSVAPQNKQLARETAAGFIAAIRGSAKAAIHVRVNDLESGLLDDDLATVVAARPDAIMLPKANGLIDIERLGTKLRVHEAAAGLTDGQIGILPIISETPASVLMAGTFIRENARLAGLTWGAEDLSAAVGARATRDQSGRYTDVFRMARTLTLLAASATSVSAIDTVFVDFRDPDGLRAECLAAERDGFTGKLAIHPGQIDIINAAFTPTQQAIEEAGMIVDAFAAAGNPGVLGIAGKMYDIPHLKRARRLLTRASAIVDA